jgi:hypothetical protein
LTSLCRLSGADTTIRDLGPLAGATCATVIGLTIGWFLFNWWLSFAG